MRKTILIDFDGTLNSYVSGWTGPPDHLPDPPLPGAIAFIRRVIASPVYKAVIFTTRALDQKTMSNNDDVGNAIREWLMKYGLEAGAAQSVEVTCYKIPCHLIIDDKAFRFVGSYPDPNELAKLAK